MLFEGGNPSLIPKYCEVETDYKNIFNLKKLTIIDYLGQNSNDLS